MSDDEQADVDPRDGRDETRNERMDRNWNDLLQELRVTQTGTQILSGFLLTLVFQPRFASLDPLQKGSLRRAGAAQRHDHRARTGAGQPASGAVPPADEAVDRPVRPRRSPPPDRRRRAHRGGYGSADPRRRARSTSRADRRSGRAPAGSRRGGRPTFLPSSPRWPPRARRLRHRDPEALAEGSGPVRRGHTLTPCRDGSTTRTSPRSGSEPGSTRSSGPTSRSATRAAAR